MISAKASSFLSPNEILRILFLSCFAFSCLCQDVKYDTQASTSKTKLNVHLVPHTHDDVGWLKTVDQYYIGSNTSIQLAAVQYILDSVVQALNENADRKFIYVEQAFFQRWWGEQSKSTRALVKKFVKEGRLEFVNGGWCMHDEATTYYTDMIDQTTLGHRYISKQFDVVPRVGWQIDPFGHSATQGYLLSAEAGFDGLFFARADYQDIAIRRATKAMEMIWRPSASLGASAQVFTGILAHHYDPPEGFRFEMNNPHTDPIQDDEDLFGFNVEARVEAFVNASLEQAAQFRTNHIMWTMGEDFAYSNANTWFKNMDKLIHYVNKDGRVRALYSTPSIYLDAKHAAKEAWPLKRDDFFPYADCPHCYWTGYFASRTALKGYVRKLSGDLQAARQLEALVGRAPSPLGPRTGALEEAVAIAQHHDAVSGTEKQHVADDYALRLARGAEEAREVVSRALGALTSRVPDARPEAGRRMRWLSAEEAGVGQAALLGVPEMGAAPKFTQCPLLNVSVCPVSTANLENRTLVLLLYNPVGWKRVAQLVRVPVADGALSVVDDEGNAVPSQAVPLVHVTGEGQGGSKGAGGAGAGEAHFTLVFEADVPPLGFSTYFISPTGTNKSAGAVLSAVETLTHGISEKAPPGVSVAALLEAGVGPGPLRARFSSATGRLSGLHNTASDVSVTVDQQYLWYNASDGGRERQASGAYIFRPNESDPFPLWKDTDKVSPSVSLVRGPLLHEVRQQLAPWLSQTVRLFRSSQHAEFEFTVGPIPIADGLGKEVVSRLSTELATGGVLFTDSNGRDMLERRRNFRPSWELNVTEPVAGNFYPVNAAAYIRDNATAVSLLTDRSLGGASLAEGQLELMLHRRLLRDDARGVGEALNETECRGSPPTCGGLTVRGTLHVNVNPLEESALWRRTHAQEVYLPLQLAFSLESTNALDNWRKTRRTRFSALRNGEELPPNVAIITMQELEPKLVLLRLAHLYEAGEHPQLGQPAALKLSKLFDNFKVEDVVELTLTANQKLSKFEPLKWRVENEDPEDVVGFPRRRSKSSLDSSLTVDLLPMEIRTFEIKLKNLDGHSAPM